MYMYKQMVNKLEAEANDMTQYVIRMDNNFESCVERLAFNSMVVDWVRSHENAFTEDECAILLSMPHPLQTLYERLTTDIYQTVNGMVKKSVEEMTEEDRPAMRALKRIVAETACVLNEFGMYAEINTEGKIPCIDVRDIQTGRVLKSTDGTEEPYYQAHSVAERAYREFATRWRNSEPAYIQKWDAEFAQFGF